MPGICYQQLNNKTKSYNSEILGCKGMYPGNLFKHFFKKEDNCSSTQPLNTNQNDRSLDIL